MNKKLCILMSALAASAFTFALKAEAKGCCCAPPTHAMKPRVYLDVGVGHAFDSQVGSDSYAVLTPNISPDTLLFSISPKNRTYPNNFLIEAGFLWSQPYQANSAYLPFVSMGIQYQYTNLDNKKTLIQLTIQDLTQGLTTPLQTNYVFSQNSLLANLKLDIYRWNRIMPYANFGLGAAWNQTKAQAPFTTDAPDIDKLPMPVSSQSTSFSYQLGAGLDFLVTENFWLSLGYSYHNFGRVEIAPPFASGTDGSDFNSLEHPFNLGNLATHNVQLTGRYVFG